MLLFRDPLMTFCKIEIRFKSNGCNLSLCTKFQKKKPEDMTARVTDCFLVF